MKFVEPSVELIQNANPYKLVEQIARICYKSEDKITCNSYKDFVKRLVYCEHFAMLEHGRYSFLLVGYDPTELLNIPGIIAIPYNIPDYPNVISWLVNVSLSHVYNPKWLKYSPIFESFKQFLEEVYIEDDHTLKTMFNCPTSLQDTKCIKSIDTPSPYLEDETLEKLIFKSLKFTIDRGTSHELVRHRCAIAQSSTRYCNYSKDKFDNEITFIKPKEFNQWSPEIQKQFENIMKIAENTYMQFVTNCSITPQIARQILPNSLMTEVVLTMNLEQWRHFFNVRYFGTTGKPHPEMRRVAKMSYAILDPYLD